MILEVFAVLLILSLVCLFIGKYLDAPPVQMGAYLFLFLLGITLMLGAVTYKTGENYNYVCACCDEVRGGFFTDCFNGSITLANITNVYSSYSGEIVQGLELNHVFGFFMSLLSAFGFVIVLVNLKSPPEFGPEDGMRDFKQ
jgi:hypothetical protein